MTDVSLSGPTFRRLQSLEALIGNTPLLAIRYRYRGSVRRSMPRPSTSTCPAASRTAWPCTSSARPTAGRTDQAGRPHRRGHQRQHGHRLRRHRPGAGPSRHDLHARLDEPRARAAHPQPGGRDRARQPRAGRLPGQHPHERGTRRQGAATSFFPASSPTRPTSKRTSGRPARRSPRNSPSRGLAADAFVAGVGTGGTVMGVGRCLRAAKPHVRIHPLEPAQSPTLSTGCRSATTASRASPTSSSPRSSSSIELDPVIAVDDGDAVLMAQKLAAQLGLGVGISSGANFLGALLVQNELGRRRRRGHRLCRRQQEVSQHGAVLRRAGQGGVSFRPTWSCWTTRRSGRAG